jgi:putative hydrolase of the HAD superfamily
MCPPSALLVDYGMVISLGQPPHVLERMAAIAGLSLPEFVERYWEHRPDYDRGTGAQEYWSIVLGRDVGSDGDLSELRRLDVESWSVMNPETLALLSEAHRRGSSLSLLSNCPHDLAEMLDEHPALADFDHLIYSSRVGVIKPDRGVFDKALELMQRRADEVLFIDDRAVNVEGALDAGLRAVLFSSPAQLRAELFGAAGQ